MTNKKAYLALALMILCGPAAAGTFNYSYVFGTFTSFSSDVDDISEDFEGNSFSVGASVGVHENAALIVQYATSSADLTTGGVKYEGDSNGTLIGAYFHTPIAAATDVILGAGFIQGNTELERDGTLVADEDYDGHLLQAGVQSKVAENVELEAFVIQSEIEDESDTSVQVGGEFYPVKDFSVSVSFEASDDTTSIGIGAKKYF